MKNILVPTDGSEFSTMAINKAKEIAELSNSGITLLHIKETFAFLSPTYPYGFSPELAALHEKETSAISDKILKDGQAKLSGFAGKVEVKSLDGSVAEEIIKFAEDNNFDMVVMGSGGLNKMHAVMGSVTRKVVLTIKTPILVVRQ